MSFWVSGATLLVGAGTAVAGASAQKSAANKAASAQEKAAALDAETKRTFYNTNATLSQPARSAGGLALARQSYLLGLTPNLDISASQSTPFIGEDGVQWSGPGSVKLNSAQSGGQTAPVPGQIQGDVLTAGNQPSGSNLVPGSNGSMPPDNTIPTGSDSVAGGDYGSYANGITAADVELDPGYQFRKDESAKALQAQLAYGGHGQNSGAAIKAAIQRSQDMASQEFGSAWERARTTRTDTWNMLNGIVQGGNNATSTLAGGGTQAAAGIGDAYGDAGNATAAGAIATGNADAGMYNGIGNSIGAGLTYYTGQKKPNTANTDYSAGTGYNPNFQLDYGSLGQTPSINGIEYKS